MSGQAIKTLKKTHISERRQWLKNYLYGKFSKLLLMAPGETFPIQQNYFDLGITSLQIEELKQDLEADLDCAVNPGIFFNNPTIEGLIAHICNDLLQSLFIGCSDVQTNATQRNEKDTNRLSADIHCADDNFLARALATLDS
jgi:acyl carrier protein